MISFRRKNNLKPVLGLSFPHTFSAHIPGLTSVVAEGGLRWQPYSNRLVDNISNLGCKNAVQKEGEKILSTYIRGHRISREPEGIRKA